jgi:hypothetical protein
MRLLILPFFTSFLEFDLRVHGGHAIDYFRWSPSSKTSDVHLVKNDGIWIGTILNSNASSNVKSHPNMTFALGTRAFALSGSIEAIHRNLQELEDLISSLESNIAMEPDINK